MTKYQVKATLRVIVSSKQEAETYEDALNMAVSEVQARLADVGALVHFVSGGALAQPEPRGELPQHEDVVVYKRGDDELQD